VEVAPATGQASGGELVSGRQSLCHSAGCRCSRRCSKLSSLYCCDVAGLKNYLLICQR
jgi:hypothetical protein